jgi:hypothetical protein
MSDVPGDVFLIVIAFTVIGLAITEIVIRLERKKDE